MARAGQEFLDINIALAERGGGFGLATLKGLRDILRR
jgi:hypothetical protein